MPGRTLRVALAAEESAGSVVLKMILARGHDLRVVISGGRGTGLGASVAEQARQADVPVRPPSDLAGTELAAWLRAAQIDVLLNVHSLVIASDEVVAAPREGSFNLHPGPLPGYAGLNVPSWALLRGERRHGVSLHRMTSMVDGGDVAFRSEFDLDERDTALSVFSTCVRDGCRLVGQLLDVLERGEPVPAHRQDPTVRRWFPFGPPDGGWLRWSQPAHELVAFVRACDYGPFRSPWGHPRCLAPAGQVEVLRASTTGRAADRRPGTVGEIGAAGAFVAAGDRWVLLEQLSVDGRRTHPLDVLSTGDLLRSELMAV